MASVKVIDGVGKSTGSRDVPDELFGGEVNVSLMHQVVTAQLAAARSGTSSTKTRADVRGGGAKPWRQKGTGRARHGSSRSPIWRGGGVVFGPHPRSYKKRLPKKMRKAALRSALASKVADGRVFVLDGFSEAKTKAAAAALKGADIDGRTLVVLQGGSDTDVSIDRAFRNLPRVAFSMHGALSTYDVLVADAVIFSSGAIEAFVSERTKDKEGAES